MMAGLATAATAAPDAATAALIENKCGSCHEQRPDGTRPRLSAVRKSPEGWELTLHRMQQWHEVAITAEQQRTLVKYLADTQGLGAGGGRAVPRGAGGAVPAMSRRSTTPSSAPSAPAATPIRASACSAVMPTSG